MPAKDTQREGSIPGGIAPAPPPELATETTAPTATPQIRPKRKRSWNERAEGIVAAGSGWRDVDRLRARKKPA
jgi:hypothetical protein